MNAMTTVIPGLTNLCPSLIRDGTVIWTSPSGGTYVTTPGSALLFPSLCRSTGGIPAPEAAMPGEMCG